MRLAWRELVRRPGRFLTAGGALTLIVVLLLVLGGILDALIGGSTGVLRAQSAELLVFSEDGRGSLVRSRLEAEQLDTLDAVEGVRSATGFGVTLLSARIEGGGDEALDVALFGYEAPNLRVAAPPGPGEGFADRDLEADGLEVGDTIEIGRAGSPVRIVGWVDDTSYNLQAGVWVEPGTWRDALAANVPDAALGEGTFQIGLVEIDDPAGVAGVAAAIEDAVPGVSALTIDEAISATPGVDQQQSVFGAIIGVTFAVAGLVVALFFALLTIERLGLLGVLKAIGASSRTLAVGLTLQAVLIAAGSLVAGGALALALAAVIPDAVPLEIRTGRVIATAFGLVVTALIGSALSFRRIVRIDPASAVGGA